MNSRPIGWFAARTRTWSPFLAGLVTICVIGSIRVAAPSPFEELQSYGFDTFQRLFPRADADSLVSGSGVVVVDIDDASLAHYGQWPWSRSVVARMIGELQTAGASAIGLDVLFAEPDRSSPAVLAASWEREDGIKVTVAGTNASLPDYDRQLADTIAKGHVVTGYGLIPAANGKAPLLSGSIAILGTDPITRFSGYGGAIPNLRPLDEAAAGQGSFTIASGGHDEIVRRLPLFMTLNGTVVPSLAIEALRVASGSDDDIGLREERLNGAGGPLTGYTARLGERQIAIAQDGTMWLRYGRRRPEMTISAGRVLDAQVREDLRRDVQGRIVLIGTSAVGLSDLRPTPISAFEPGVNIHAGAIEQILTGIDLSRPSVAVGIEFIAAALLSAGIASLIAFAGVNAGLVLTIVGLAGSLGGAAIAFARFGLLFDPTLIAMQSLVVFVVTMLARYLLIERRAKGLRSAFGHYISPNLVEALVKDPDRLRLGGEEREMTFLFSDLEGFTSFTEAVEPSVLVTTLNAYLDGLCTIVTEHGGTVDKIVGDAVHAIFNAPIDQPDHAERAVRCAMAADVFGLAFSAANRHHAAPFGITRIGVNTGRAVVGNFGGARRFDYTAHGDAINTAARLEAANKRLGTRLCVSRATVDAAGELSDIRFRPIGELALKGKSRCVSVFLPCSASAPEMAWHDRYADAFARLSRGEASGVEAVLALHALHPDDAILSFHAKRIASGQRDTAVALQAA